MNTPDAGPPRPQRPAPTGPIAALVAAGAVAAGCRAARRARMALPVPLAERPAERFEGWRPGRDGTMRLGGQALRYEREADRLTVLDRLERDRLALRVDHDAGRARCDGRRIEGRAGSVAGALRPLAVQCRFEGPWPGRLELREARGAAAGTRDAREGEAELAGVRLVLRSVHELQGTRLPLDAPAGYLLLRDGRPVAALELTDAAPVLRRAAGLDEAAAHAVLQAAVVLGLLWDPARVAR